MDATPTRRRDGYLFLGGLFIIITGVLSIVNGVEGLHSRALILWYLSGDEAGIYLFCGVLSIIFGLIAILAGVYALRPRPHLTPILLGAVLGMLAGGVYGFLIGFGAIVIFGFANIDL